MTDLLARAGLRAMLFTGRESQRRRTQNVVELHDDPRTRVLFATDAGGVGLNLQRQRLREPRAALEPAVLGSASRIHRLGQRRPIHVYHLVSEGSTEARMRRGGGLVQGRLFKGPFDGASDAVRFERAGALRPQRQDPPWPGDAA